MLLYSRTAYFFSGFATSFYCIIMRLAYILKSVKGHYWAEKSQIATHLAQLVLQCHRVVWPTEVGLDEPTKLSHVG